MKDIEIFFDLIDESCNSIETFFFEPEIYNINDLEKITKSSNQFICPFDFLINSKNNCYTNLTNEENKYIEICQIFCNLGFTLYLVCFEGDFCTGIYGYYIIKFENLNNINIVKIINNNSFKIYIKNPNI